MTRRMEALTEAASTSRWLMCAALGRLRVETRRVCMELDGAVDSEQRQFSLVRDDGSRR